TGELWAVLRRPQLPVPAHVVRAKARLMRALLEQLMPVMAGVAPDREGVHGFFAGVPGGPGGGAPPVREHASTPPPPPAPSRGTPQGGGSRFGICKRTPALCP